MNIYYYPMADVFDPSIFKINVLYSLNQYSTYSFTHSWNNYTSYFSENNEDNTQQNLKFITVCNLADEINLKGNDDIICKSSNMQVLKDYGGHTITISIKPNMKIKFLQVFAIINNEMNYTEELSSESVELIYVSDTTDSEDENHHFGYHHYSNETEDERRKSRETTKKISREYFDLL